MSFMNAQYSFCFFYLQRIGLCCCMCATRSCYSRTGTKCLLKLPEICPEQHLSASSPPSLCI